MKHAAACFLIVSMLVCAMPVGFAQDAGATPATPVFDAELAERAG